MGLLYVGYPRPEAMAREAWRPKYENTRHSPRNPLVKCCALWPQAREGFSTRLRGR
jgi:hypothetical protein